MPLVEIVAIELGGAIAKSILKFWLKETAFGDDISSSLIDLLKAKTSDLLAQRRGARQFESIGEQVGESLLPLFQAEGVHLDEGDRTAVALAAAKTFNAAKISSELLVKRNLEPIQLAHDILAANSDATCDFSEAATELYRRIIKESCTYIVDIASQLPAFTEHSFAEVLKREDQIITITKDILETLRKMREQLDPMIEAERFEIEYREAVARNLDVLQLIGADISLANRRHRLSVAYITLAIERKLPSLSAIAGDAEDEVPKDIVSADVALAHARRLLICGLAGSGKTTLLQWIAVRAATKTFEGELTEWNTYIPFYIRLRHCGQFGLPRPEAFPGFVAPAIADTMPKGWVHTVLKAGRSLVLVDGVDEVPISQREDVHTWLSDLVETYKNACFLVTSRPHAIQEGWMNHESFDNAELQPMELTDIYSFIDHWHDAVREELQEDDEKNELGPLADHLKEQARQNRSLRTLATSPLLCAMLCALNRDRRRQLPVNRTELYKACCSLLLERRDKERRVDLIDYPHLTFSQKERLLQDLAYWMIQNNLSEAKVEDVDERFAKQLAHMPGIPQDAAASAVRQLLVERAGIIREPVANQIDFTHRTFEEFFAAQAALDAIDIEKLVASAHNDQWREVVILVSGLASKVLCEQLIGGLIRRGDAEVKYRYQLHLLAVSCLETVIQLGPEVRAEVEKRLSHLVPPKNLTEAKAVAAAGELAVRHLRKKKKLSAPLSVACIRALALIGGDSALDLLEEYADDRRESVTNELLHAWDMFDKEAYAKRVLSLVIRDRSELFLSRLTSLDGLQHLTNLISLHLTDCRQLTDLSPLAGLTNLTTLDLTHCDQLTDLSPLAGLANLTTLSLARSGHWRLNDLSPLAGLANLTTLSLAHRVQLKDLSPLAGLINLTTLDLTGCRQLTDLSPLAGLTNLTTLDLTHCDQLTDLSPLAGLTNLTTLSLIGCGPQFHQKQIIDQLRHGNKINAIKLYRELTGIGLRESKEVIDRTVQDLRAGREYDLSPLMASVPLTPDMQETIRGLAGDEVRRGHKINAIMLYREQAGVSLQEAKEAVDQIELELKDDR